MQVDFFHLTQMPLERALPQVAERVVERGGRLLIVAEGEALRAKLDALLWSYAPESFLPHAAAGTGEDAAQPILIADSTQAANGARNIVLADGIWRDAALAFDRAVLFFDGDSITEARAAWKELVTRDGVERRYWKQNEAGRWEQIA
ncbi:MULTISPECIES: DNA polymerase III subunit chi [unclassified Sphingosinithalassobacter]|uniref:DNA polymerase III subunit chi n=1 Tax=unclassified Sphingosinithalassobacter TaxID=2676235 RepID=UPI00165D92F8|nr:DNA polymerase III subunit chi [Sphingosinithalassobacter sp. CS137]